MGLGPLVALRADYRQLKAISKWVGAKVSLTVKNDLESAGSSRNNITCYRLDLVSLDVCVVDGVFPVEAPDEVGRLEDEESSSREPSS